MPIDLNQPQVLGPLAALAGALLVALVSVTVAGINQLFNRSMHRQRIAADHALAETKIAADIDLAERRFGFDQGLAERRFAYDREFNDHKRRVELAEQLLAGFLQLRAVVREVRSPLGYSNEGEDRPTWEGETTDQAETRRRHFVPMSRLLKHSDFVNGLMARRYQMNAYFGPAADHPFAQVWTVLAEIQVAARGMMASVNADGSLNAPADLWQRWQSAIWADFETPDPHAAAIDAAVEAIEGICRPVLTGRTS